MKHVALLAFCLVSVLGTLAAANDGGVQSPFRLGAGARDLGLGGAALAEVDPYAAPYWNASLLARAERVSLGAFHTGLYGSQTSYQYVGLAVPTMDFGGFGCGLFRLGVGGIEKRDESNYLLGDIDERRLAMYLGYGRMVSGYDIGVTVNLEQHSLDNHSATSSPGLSLSASRLLRPSLRRVSRIGITVNGCNLIRPRMKLVDANIAYPTAIEAGVSATLVPKPSWDHSLTVCARLAKAHRVDPELAVGMEYAIDDQVRVGGGIRDGKAAFGAGVSYRSIRFDYAVVDRDLGSLHTFSISADIGMAMKDKRRVRAERREAEFHELINRRLGERNREMISDLVARGQDLIRSHDLQEASVTLERALFLAAGSGLDTMSVCRVARDAKVRLEEAQLISAFAADMDSAWTRFDSGDYLSAKYFADLALARLPDSREASDLRTRIDEAIRRSITRDQMVTSQIVLTDSLLSYGKYDEALITARAVSEVSGADDRVRLLVKRAEFSHWLDIAEAAFAVGEFDKADAALDSALFRFPKHPSCIGLRAQITQELRRASAAAPAVEWEAPEPLSDELREEVEATYKSGQKLFEQGNLPGAVERWEKVQRLAPGYMSVGEYLVKAYKFLGVELYTASRLEEAVAVWKKAAALDPGSSEIAGYIKRTESEIAMLEKLSYE